MMMFNSLRKLILGLAALSALSFSVHADYDGRPMPKPSEEKPEEIKDVGIDEQLGTQLDLSLSLRDESGKNVALASYYHNKPVIISLVYFGCPGLCNYHLNGVVDTLKGVDWNAGDKYEVLAISFDPKEGSDLAIKKKENYLKSYGRPAGDKGFHFLTADESTIKAITKQIGFKYKWNEEAHEWSHASAAVITTPAGVISRYLHGIMFDAKTMRMALGEAGQGKIGSIIDKFVWYCFHYDPKTSQYTLVAFRLVQLGAILIVLVLSSILIPFWLKNRRPTGRAS